MISDCRVIGHMVTRNEADRYLESSLAWLGEMSDVVHVYDDCSTDGTAVIARVHADYVDCRDDTATPFADHEGQFRQAAWRAMEHHCAPTGDDWVLCIDADEYLRATMNGTTTPKLLVALVAAATKADVKAISFRVGEVFSVGDALETSVRTDGYWGQITGCRLVRWRPDGMFADRAEGCGSVPEGWAEGALRSTGMAIMHLGYATDDDRRAKYHRYAAGVGHNPSHVESILTTPTLTSWADWAR